MTPDAEIAGWFWSKDWDGGLSLSHATGLCVSVDCVFRSANTSSAVEETSSHSVVSLGSGRSNVGNLELIVPPVVPLLSNLFLALPGQELHVTPAR